VEEVLRAKISKPRKDLFSQDEIPKKREKREKEHSRLNEKKQQCFILLLRTQYE